MITRREAVRLLGSASAGAWLAAAQIGLDFSIAPNASAAPRDDSAPSLAPGAPTSPERLALIEAFKKESDGLEKKFEARTHKSDWVMPYRFFRPEAAGKLPLVMYLHGSGGLGDDNSKQLGLAAIFLVHASGCSRRTKKPFPATLSYRRPTADGSDTISRNRPRDRRK